MAKIHGVRYWKKKAWDEFSKYIRIRDALRTTGTIEKAVCCSCGKVYNAFGVGCLQAGHFIPGRGNGILFEPAGCHGQCYNCNVNLKSNWPGYYVFMQQKYGNSMIEHLLTLNKSVVKYKPFELEEMRNLFKHKYLEMFTTKKLLVGESYEDYRENLIIVRPFGSHNDGLLSNETG